MAIIVERKRLSFWERTYLPQILSGLYITLKNFFAPKVTLEYPDQQPVIPQGYRGAPVLVCDSDGRHKCVPVVRVCVPVEGDKGYPVGDSRGQPVRIHREGAS